MDETGSAVRLRNSKSEQDPKPEPKALPPGDEEAQLEAERTFHQEATGRNIDAMKEAVISGIVQAAAEARAES